MGVAVGVKLASPDVASPTMVLRMGAWLAIRPPMVAYALPDLRLKKGRGEGDSSQHLTWILSALQHHWLFLLEHCVIDSPPTRVSSVLY